VIEAGEKVAGEIRCKLAENHKGGEVEPIEKNDRCNTIHMKRDGKKVTREQAGGDRKKKI